MARAQKSARVLLPRGTIRRDGVVLGTKRKADLVDLSERRRAQMYALIEAHPETAEELLARVKSAIKPDIKPKKAPTARPKTERQFTDSPGMPGYRDYVEHVVNPIELMRARRQLDALAYRAASHIGAAYETINGAVGGAMDFDRARGGGSPGAPPPQHYLEAADVLSQAKKYLYPSDYRVIGLVVIEGLSIQGAAQAIHGAKPSRAEREETSRRLREGLHQLAERWWPRQAREETEREIVSHHTADAKTYSPQVAGVIERGDVVHATGHKIFRK